MFGECESIISGENLHDNLRDIKSGPVAFLASNSFAFKNSKFWFLLLFFLINVTLEWFLVLCDYWLDGH